MFWIFLLLVTPGRVLFSPGPEGYRLSYTPLWLCLAEPVTASVMDKIAASRTAPTTKPAIAQAPTQEGI